MDDGDNFEDNMQMGYSFTYTARALFASIDTPNQHRSKKVPQIGEMNSSNDYEKKHISFKKFILIAMSACGCLKDSYPRKGLSTVR